MSQPKKKFLAIYIGSVSANEKSKLKSEMSEEGRQEIEKAGMDAWGKWVMKNQDSIVDYGTPLGKTKRVNSDGARDIENLDVAYIIVQAESLEDAAKLFVDHPHFTIFPGDSIEVMECLSMPGASKG